MVKYVLAKWDKLPFYPVFFLKGCVPELSFKEGVFQLFFLATLVALHFTPIGGSVNRSFKLLYCYNSYSKRRQQPGSIWPHNLEPRNFVC